MMVLVVDEATSPAWKDALRRPLRHLLITRCLRLTMRCFSNSVRWFGKSDSSGSLRSSLDRVPIASNLGDECVLCPGVPDPDFGRFQRVAGPDDGQGFRHDRDTPPRCDRMERVPESTGYRLHAKGRRLVRIGGDLVRRTLDTARTLVVGDENRDAQP